jgi:hypothetical protein
MVASAADDGVAPAVVEASTKLLASPEVGELEANYAKWGYCLAARLLGQDRIWRGGEGGLLTWAGFLKWEIIFNRVFPI